MKVLREYVKEEYIRKHSREAEAYKAKLSLLAKAKLLMTGKAKIPNVYYAEGAVVWLCKDEIGYGLNYLQGYAGEFRWDK